MADSADDPPLPARRRYGSVLILVVAVLGLLAVLGTVYLVASHTDRTTTRAMSAALNLDLARDAVMNQVRTVLFSATVDGHGNIAGLGDGSTYASSRFFDYPEHNGGQANGIPDCPDEPWLARNIQRQPPPDQRQPPPDDDLCFIAAIPPALQSTGYQPKNQLNVIGSPAPNFADAPAYLLDYTSGAGEHYRFGVRIVDLSRMADLNTGAPALPDTSGESDLNGEYLSSYLLNDGGPVANSRRNLYAAGFTVTDWQKQILSIEKPAAGIAFFDLADELQLRTESFFNLPDASRPAAVWPGGISPSTQDRYTTFSFTRDLRLRPSPIPVAAASKQPSAAIAPPYTLTPANGTIYPPDCGPYVWPLAPAKVGINPALDGGVNVLSSIFYHARAATNIASAMEASGFSPEESRAFAANYLTYRWSGIAPDPGNATAYYFPAGPSFIDDKGICIRATDSTGNIIDPATSQFGSSTDLSAIAPGTASLSPSPPANSRIYLGFLPQPFINKIAVEMQNDPNTHTPTVTNVAIELYNPFPVALSLRGFTLQVHANGPAIPLDGHSVPACGYLVILQNKNGSLSTKIQGGLSPFVLKDNPDALTPDSTGGAVVLTRPYIGRVGTSTTSLVTQPAPAAQTFPGEIDAFPYDNLVPTPLPTIAPNQSVIYFLRRSNDSPAANSVAGQPQPEWEAAIHAVGASVCHTDGSSDSLLLGAPSPNDDSTIKFSFDLTDRYTTDVHQQGGGAIVGPLKTFHNLADFNRIPRMCNEIQNPNVPPPTADPNGANAAPLVLNLLLSQQLGGLFTPSQLPFTSGTQFPYDAQLHFDFKADTTFFQRMTQTPAQTDAYSYDARAVRLFDYLAMLDRVSDPSIDIGGGSDDINKLRIAGRINVNTADQATLAAITNMTSTMASQIETYCQTKGIRTLSELLSVVAAGDNSSKNLHDRDEPWAKIINQCATRSDTFAVYGYLEAIRANPAAVPPHDNAADWYDVLSTTDDPHDGSGKKNIRIAARRWVAIIDRSWCNYPRGEPQFELPRLVAIRDLPR